MAGMITARVHDGPRRTKSALLTLLVVAMEMCQVAQAGAGLTTDKLHDVNKGAHHVGGKGYLRADGAPIAEVDRELATPEARMECGMYATAKLVLAEQDLRSGDDDATESEPQTQAIGPQSDAVQPPKEAWAEVQDLMGKTDCPSRMRKVEMFLQFFHPGSKYFAAYAGKMAAKNYLVCEMTPESAAGWKWDGEEDCEQAWRSKMLRQADKVVSNTEEARPAWLAATQQSNLDWKQTGRLSLISSGVGIFATGAYMFTLGSLVVSSDIHYTSEYEHFAENDPRRAEFPDRRSRFGPSGGKERYSEAMMKRLFAGPVMASLAPEMQSMLLSAGTGFSAGGTLVGLGGAFVMLAGVGTSLVAGAAFDSNKRTVGEYISYQDWLKERSLKDDTPVDVTADVTAEVAEVDPLVRNPLSPPE